MCRNIISYSFSLPDGDILAALWVDGTAVDEDPGFEATLTFHDFIGGDVTGIDVLKGSEQSIITNSNDNDLVIQNLIVRDYPIILHIIKSTQGTS
jgi:hypothetical protein